jgi:antitoxin VapB
MALNIKDPEADRLARRLARLTGESITQAVKEAVRMRIDAEARRRNRAHVLERARRIVAESAPHAGAPAEDRTAFLYDEDGLPA